MAPAFSMSLLLSDNEPDVTKDQLPIFKSNQADTKIYILKSADNCNKIFSQNL